MVVGTADDLLSVPQGTKHWFDGGPEGNFTVIRLFSDQRAGSPTSPATTSPPPSLLSKRVMALQGLVTLGEGIASGGVTHRVVADAVLLDIEGTISPVHFVKQTLFPYARSGWLSSSQSTVMSRAWNSCSEKPPLFRVAPTR